MLESESSLLPNSPHPDQRLRVVSVGLDSSSLDELERLLTTLGVVPEVGATVPAAWSAARQSASGGESEDRSARAALAGEAAGTSVPFSAVGPEVSGGVPGL